MNRRVEAAAESIYGQVWNVLETWFKVPAEPPTLPAEQASDVTSFRPAPGFLRYLKFLFWIVLVIIDGAILIAWLAIAIAVPWLGVILAIPAAFVAIVPDILAYVAIHLRYDTTWYVIGRRSLRIRRGIWFINETTITFENVQNIHITQGPLQRYFGIADLLVETAGGGGGHGKGEASLATHLGLIEGIDNAEELRTLILGRLRESKTAGLGDEDDDDSEGPNGFTAEQLVVLREIRDVTLELVLTG